MRYHVGERRSGVELPHLEKSPRIHPSVYVDPTARINGDVGRVFGFNGTTGAYITDFSAENTSISAFGISLATYLLTSLSGLAAEKKFPEFRATLGQGLSYLIVINSLAAVRQVVQDDLGMLLSPCIA